MYELVFENGDPFDSLRESFFQPVNALVGGHVAAADGRGAADRSLQGRALEFSRSM
jgi:hypothetical protein